jgi:hypothetical protein
MLQYYHALRKHVLLTPKLLALLRSALAVDQTGSVWEAAASIISVQLARKVGVGGQNL